MIAVGDRALVLHAGVRRLDQLVAVFLEGILAKIVLVTPRASRLRLRELFLGLVQVFGQRVEVERQVAQPIAEVHVVADVQRDVVVVDWILHQPIPTRVAVAEVRLADKLSVRNVNEIVRNRDADLHRLDFVAPLVLVRPPDAGAFSLARRVNPGPASRIFTEGNATKPARLERIPGIVEVDLVDATCL